MQTRACKHSASYYSVGGKLVWQGMEKQLVIRNKGVCQMKHISAKSGGTYRLFFYMGVQNIHNFFDKMGGAKHFRPWKNRGCETFPYFVVRGCETFPRTPERGYETF